MGTIDQSKRNIGNNLARLRRDMGMTQEMLAEKLGLNNRTISRWENGICLPDTQMWCILSEIYGVPVGDLLNPCNTMEDNEAYGYIDTITQKGNYPIHIEDMKECYPFIDFEFGHMMGVAKELKVKGFSVTNVHPYGFIIFINDDEEASCFKEEIGKIVEQYMGFDGVGIASETQKKIEKRVRELQSTIMDELSEELGVTNMCSISGV